MSRRIPGLMRRGGRAGVGGGGTAAAWSPRDIPSMQNEWVGSNIIDTDIAGFVRQAVDDVGGQNAIQADTLKQPALITSGILGGAPHMKFDGVNDVLSIASLSHGSTDQMSFLIACHITTITNGRYLFSYGLPRGACITSNRVSFTVPSGGPVNATLPIGESLALIFEWDRVTGAKVYNGETLIDSAAVAGSVALATSGAFSFPAWATGSATNEGAFAEFDICAGVLTSGERTSWADYCAANYGYTP